jgi:sulfite reductase alpha subunit-like flavoprotein
MPDKKAAEVTAKKTDEKAEEKKEFEPLKVNEGEEYYNFDTAKMIFRKYKVEKVDPDGSFLLTEDGKIVGIVTHDNEKQANFFRENYKQDKEEVRGPALKMIDEKISALGTVRQKIKNS